jgi:hypothetical protein
MKSMSTTNFFDKNGNLSSQRKRVTDSIEITRYPNDPRRGGTTFRGPHMTMRMDKNGRLMSWGLNDDRGMHFDSSGRKLYGIAQF